MHCKHATRLLSERLERPLTLIERMRLRFHLSICNGCSRFSEQMLQLRHIAHTFSRGGKQ
ncbi:zf-HC2 domain-containing protein [Celerinatantimonas yamalensis]|uniref:Zf-HC2 domain-containing protein n=1 Tax=Celerinatantimonas yamalensis TaxID=559956 RepID=A0ABW9G7N3_9GAMM